MPATNKAIIELARQWDKAREQAALVQELRSRAAAAAAEPTPDAANEAAAETAADDGPKV